MNKENEKAYKEKNIETFLKKNLIQLNSKYKFFEIFSIKKICYNIIIPETIILDDGKKYYINMLIKILFLK